MSSSAIKSPRVAEQFVTGLKAATAAGLVSAGNDVSLFIDADGVIQDTAADAGNDLQDVLSPWCGRPWADVVTVESRPKIEALLRTGPKASPSRWRHVNHPAPDGGLDIPIMYRVFAVDDSGQRIAMGRDLRPLSALQQQLIDVQQSMERDYERLYQAETRYRMLFQMASEPILIVDADARNIVEANPAAAKLMDKGINKLIGSKLDLLFDEPGAAAVSDLLATVRAAGKADDITAATRQGTDVLVGATLLRREDATLYLMHLRTSVELPADAAPATSSSAVLEIVERSPDGFVVTDTGGRVLAANEAFLDLCQVASELQVRNQPLDQWLGRPGVDVTVLRKNLQQRGSIRQFLTRVNPEFGAPVDVELSAVAALDADPPCYGFVVRHVLRRSEPGREYATQPLGRSLEQMTDLVGRVPLKDLVRETTDLIERMCIEAALKLTTNNRASAADMLGLSRQSLYVKLRRYGIGDPDSLDD
ncbi:MAG: transcriptional regulator PpsR [Pseudomonadota bacterium]